jgi:cytochrome c-type biogenesis protein CcmE
MSDYQPPTDSNGKNSQSNSDDANRQHIQQVMRRLYIILIVVGLGLGAIVSVGIVALIQRLGLTDVPEQVDDSNQSSADQFPYVDGMTLVD